MPRSSAIAAKSWAVSTAMELSFIQSRGAFIALEFIEDTVHSFRGEPDKLERFLRSET
jgi:hypothetical protein